MIVAGKLIEYLDNGKFIVAMTVESQPNRLRLLNQNGREVNLPINRVIHCSSQHYQTSIERDILLKELRYTAEQRASLMLSVNLFELWEILKEEHSNSFSPDFLADLTFGGPIGDNHVAAFIRCIFEDKVFFKFKEGVILVNSSEKVEQIQKQQEKEALREKLIEDGAKFITKIISSQTPHEKLEAHEEQTLNLLKDYYLFGNDSPDKDIAQKLLKAAGQQKPHDPFHILVKAGIWSANENIPLLRHDIPVNFSLAARQQAELILQRGQNELFTDPGRVDLTHLNPITIDGPTTLDFDDALSIEKQGDSFVVGVHISDVAHYVRPGDPLFFEAMRRGTSIYFPEGQIPMLPRHLSQGICSLIQDENRATLSFFFTLSEEAEVLKAKIIPSIIRVKRRLTYEEVDKMLSTDKEIQLFEIVRKKLRRNRLSNGALLLPFPDVNIFIDNQGKVHVYLSKSDTPARTIVSELMILANTEAAKYVADRMVPGLYRSQPPLQHRMVFGENDDLFQNTLQRKNIPRGELSLVAKPHSGLGVSHYTTVTSPIRRLLDLVMQHQLNSIIRRKEPTFSEEMCKDFTAVLARTLATVQTVRQQRQRYWLLKYLSDQQGQHIDALVIQVGPKRVSLLLTDILMDIDMPIPLGKKISPEMMVKVVVTKADPLDNTVRFDW